MGWGYKGCPETPNHTATMSMVISITASERTLFIVKCKKILLSVNECTLYVSNYG